jgi:hypothetical protein
MCSSFNFYVDVDLADPAGPAGGLNVGQAVAGNKRLSLS